MYGIMTVATTGLKKNRTVNDRTPSRFDLILDSQRFAVPPDARSQKRARRLSPLAPRAMTRSIRSARFTRLIRSTLLLALVAGFGSRTAAAQQATNAAPSLVVSALNTTAAGESDRPMRATVQPHDVLRYTLTFTNPTGRSLGNVELKNPIPAGVHLVAGSTHASRTDARAEFSADGGKSWSTAPAENVMVDGQAISRPIPADRFTHVRWVLRGAVGPQATVTADFEARVGGR
jgi:uncharacterized repeat protein (TIGR01451 family)